MATAPEIFILDDDAAMRDFIAVALRKQDFEKVKVESLDRLKVLLSEHHPMALIMDLNLGNADGLDVIDTLASEEYRGPLVIISGVEARTIAKVGEMASGKGLNVVGTLQKPFPPSALNALLQDRMVPPTSPVDDLRNAIESGELTAWFQPIIELETDRVVGAEALARWVKPDGAVIPPFKFIDLAEENGLMRDLTRRVLDASLTAVREWRRAGHESVWVAINSSPSLVSADSFVPGLLAFLERHELPPEAIQLEITESVAMTNLDLMAKVLARLSIKGIEIAIDDFGTGFSSLTALHRLPFAKLKIDQSFVRRLGADSEANAIVDVTLGLAKALGLKVVAEGVETWQIAQELKFKGCQLAQGYYFAKPMPASDMLDFLNAHAGKPA